MTIGITHIVNASGVPNTFPKTFTYLYIDIKDKETSNVLSCIPTTNIFIEAGIDAGAVLIHCYGGVSRSAALIAAFLMSSYGWSYDHTINELKSKRSVIAINAGFEQQLKAYSRCNFDVYTAQQLLLRDRIKSLKDYRILRGNHHHNHQHRFHSNITYHLNHHYHYHHHYHHYHHYHLKVIV